MAPSHPHDFQSVMQTVEYKVRSDVGTVDDSSFDRSLGLESPNRKLYLSADESSVPNTAGCQYGFSAVDGVRMGD